MGYADDGMDGANLESVNEVRNVISLGWYGGLALGWGRIRKSRFPMSALRMDKDIVPGLNEVWNDIVPHGKVGQEPVGENNPWSGG